MKTVRRVVIECVVIACILGTISFAASSTKKTGTSFIDEGLGVVTMPFYIIPEGEALKITEGYKDKFKEIFGKAGVGNPIPLYSKETGKLGPAFFPIDKTKWKYGDQYTNYVTNALFVENMVASNNSLEDRVRKLENTVNKIIGECCPEAKK